ncbi:hypothetical protein A6R68_01029 [Neotoma lepida]|uniref:Uncharacterized protein n=1 Tax=Neotoma lepida TaxID=56216 RepID=A0A1A6GW85_NEOLE|nr:hypothetical protein A6R68_01029 [Neotoma lepida]
MAPILLTVILEFLPRRLLELASNEAQRRGTRRFITPELLDVTVYNDTLLSELFQNTTISQVALSGRPTRGHRCQCYYYLLLLLLPLLRSSLTNIGI